MEKLPPEIALEIFYRLSPESVVQCKLVCKSWYSLLPRGRGDDDGNYFANMHLSRRQHHQQRNLDDYSKLNFISLHDQSDQEEEESVVGEFHFTEYNEVEGLNCKVKKLVFTQICISGWLSMMRLDGSCNGLLCLTITYHQRGANYSLKTTIGICNPVLHEYVTLPQSDLQIKHDDCSTVKMVVTGFGHNPITEEYKVVRVYYRRQDSSYIGDVEVYTLGKSSNGGAAGMWRSKGTINYRLRNWSRYVLINGSIHWLAKADEISEQNIIVSCDLEDEEFRVIPIPSNLNITHTSPLRELRGCLCLIGETREILLPPDLNRNLDIWALKKDYMNKEESWVKEFSIKWAAGAAGLPWYSPVCIKKNKKDGDDAILCWCYSKSAKRLVSYDPKIQKFEKVGGWQDVVNGLVFYQVLHINSLVSLKALGEDAKYAEARQGP